MSFLKSGLDALLGQTLQRLDLDDAAQLTPEMVQRLEPQALLDLGQQSGLEIAASVDSKEAAERIWLALQPAMSGNAASEHPEPSEEVAREIPWGYGQDRVTGIAVDPNRLYIYWEVTDEAIKEARRGLGADRDQAWLNLRVYDITGRLFDGTNAHGYIDEKVGREDRQWFLDLGKPGSDAIVELGMKSPEGYFVKIARSGRVEFPRWGTPATGAPEWMTVRVKSNGFDLENAGHSAPSNSESAGAPASGAAPEVRTDHTTGEFAPYVPQMEREAAAADFNSYSQEWVEHVEHISTARSHTWERESGSWSWTSGPYRYSVSMPGAVTERFVGDRQVHRIGERIHVVYGPWEVVIRGIGAHMEKTVLGRWETFRSWVTEEGGETTSVIEGEPGMVPGSSDRLLAGASERRWSAGSESRLGGASETWLIGASERRLAGASEYSYLAASERMLRGASERVSRGASERLLQGASEQRLAGASERLHGGASEKLAGGASERHFPPLPPKPGQKP